MKRKKLSLGCLVVVFICGAFLLWLLFPTKPPRDADVIAHFKEHQATFELLKTMMKEDFFIDCITPSGIARTDEVKPRPVWDSRFDEERFKTYMRLLADAKAAQAIRDGEDLRFPVDGWGMANKGWRVAITYRDIPPTNTIDNINNFKKRTSRWADAYRPIEDGWYLWIIW